GTSDPQDATYQALAQNGFADWRLEIGGLVEHPMRLSLADLRALPSRTQITRHDCVEGWSCIGKWTGVPLSRVLAPLGVQRRARYVVFFCYDRVPGAFENYYESIDLAEAAHPETILAYGMNGKTLPIPYGAPLRLRLGRQLGYKMPKYLRRIALVEGFRDIEGGHGGFYEDNGYEWFAGI
ncbi:MAG: molybdopterin-dependent oxidoreductase, partial [Acetobacteraceae bacterium]